MYVHVYYVHVCICMYYIVTYVFFDIMVVTYTYKDSTVAILCIQNSIILIQTTEYNNFMLD